MTQLAYNLRYRIQLQEAVDIENDAGGFDRGYSTLTTIWAGFRPIKYPTYVRGEQVDTVGTHEFIIRRCAVDSLGRAFSIAFGVGFNSIPDLNPLKSEYFILVQRGSSVKGRRFRINSVINVREHNEYFKVITEEIEEVGTGWPA